MLAGAPRLRRPARGVQIVVGPVPVPLGGEVTECTYLKLPAAHDLAVHRVQIKVAGGSHHVHLYRPQDPAVDLADGHETCNFALDFSQWQLVLASQKTLLDWRLPPGIAFHLRAGEQLAAQTHFVDSGLLRTPTGEGWAVMNLHTMPRARVRAYAGAFFGQDRDVVVAPKTKSTATTYCRFPHPVTLLSLTGHYHYRGTRFTAHAWDGALGKLLYAEQGYLEPVVATFGAAEAPTVDGIEWMCEYENPDDVTYTFGPFTDRNEHCNLFASYYPASLPHEDITCVQDHGEVRVDVRGY